jgi:carbamoyltransferase
MNIRDQFVLAFNDPWHDSSFFFRDANGLVHVEAERFSRRKHEFVNPFLAFCSLYEDKVETFSHVAIHEGGPVSRFMKQLVLVKAAGGSLDDLPEVPLGEEYLIEQLGAPSFSRDSQSVINFLRHLMRSEVQLYFCGHHASHAANAFYSSPFSAALSITLDGGGLDFDRNTVDTNVLDESRVNAETVARKQIYGAVYDCGQNGCVPLHQVEAFSIGTLWHRVVTGVLGLHEGEEGAAMAMAAFGDKDRFYSSLIEPCVAFRQDYALSASERGQVASWMERMKGNVRVQQDAYDIAAALQVVTEERVRSFLGRHLSEGVRNLCLAGGTFLNCQITGKIHEWFPQLEGVYLPPAPYDGGLSIGVAQLIEHEVLSPGSHCPATDPAAFAMGQSYNREQVLEAAERAGVVLKEAEDSFFLKLISAGKIGALFKGPAESGRRALGNRSIIAHPGIKGLKTKLNDVIKHRQAFRPFAPMVLAEYVSEWFECPKGFESPYMSFAVTVKPAVRQRIQNVVHEDGSARLQTVHRSISPHLHHLLTSWHEITGLPVLLNTSFNDREPIIETPSNAFETFGRTELDCLYFADHRLIAFHKNP